MASYLANLGCHVFTFDYRGIGSSRSQHIKMLKDHGFLSWAQDFKSVSEHAKKSISQQYSIHDRS